RNSVSALSLEQSIVVRFRGIVAEESGVRSQESGVRSQESGVRCQVSGVRCQVSSVKCQVSSVRLGMCLALPKGELQSIRLADGREVTPVILADREWEERRGNRPTLWGASLPRFAA